MPDEAALNRSPPTPHRRRTAGAQRSLSWLITIAIFLLIFRRIPYQKLIAALGEADYVTFLALMVPNTVFYFCWDTLMLSVVIRWFHGPVRYRDLLPVRAASYVVAFFNTNLGRGALAAYRAASSGCHSCRSAAPSSSCC